MDDPLREPRRAEHQDRVEVLAVLFGVLSGAFFGALAVTVRIALRSGAEPEAGAAIAAATAFVTAAAVALAAWSTIRPGQLWAFVLVGMLVPGVSQIDGKYMYPAWSPPAEVKRDKPSLPSVIAGGSPHNPMGVAAMTL